ncbi:flagellar protein [Paenibacillus hodogayensis]|uniref:Flagellar protein n=1 Tax=Paenibacillus hodogayensis TaxID=279208 RepID=A0ABV5VTX4_9BACL
MIIKLLVDNCPSCGAVYQKNARHLCGACSAKQDSELDLCLDYLWKFPKSTVEELSGLTHISGAVISAFVKEGRLSRGYTNLTYPCECCGASIRHNRLCGSCSRTFQHTALQLQSSLLRPSGNVYNIRK